MGGTGRGAAGRGRRVGSPPSALGGLGGGGRDPPQRAEVARREGRARFGVRAALGGTIPKVV